MWALIRGRTLINFSGLKGGHFFSLARINVLLVNLLLDFNRVADILGRKFVVSELAYPQTVHGKTKKILISTDCHLNCVLVQ